VTVLKKKPISIGNGITQIFPEKEDSKVLIALSFKKNFDCFTLQPPLDLDPWKVASFPSLR